MSKKNKQLALVIDLNVCVGCHACVTSCKEWNTSGSAGPLTDLNAYGANPSGTFFNRVQTFEAGTFPNTQTVHFLNRVYIAKSHLVCQSAQRGLVISAKKMALCWWIMINASVAVTAPGPVLTALES